MKQQIIQQGAEAVLIKRGNDVLKRRVKKGYRIAELDEKLRKQRTRKEVRLLGKAAQFIPIPKVKRISEKDKEIGMKFIRGKKLSEHLDNLKNWKEVCFAIGENIAKLHDEGIIHGDLTTSNMIWVEAEKKLYFIDFGLGFSNGRVEDKAVDLHLIKQALEAKHFKRFEKFFDTVLEGYKISGNYKQVMERFEKVERRGRYKNRY